MLDKKKITEAIIWINVSCLASGIMVNMVRHVSEHMTSPEIIFFRNIFAFLMFLPLVYWKGFKYFKTNQVKIHVVRSCSGMISMLAFFYAISKMNLSVVTSLSFTAPLFTAVLAYFFFKEKMSKHRMLGLGLGFVGVLVVIRPGFEGFNPLSMIVIFSAVFWAISGIVIKTLLRTEKPIVITFYMTIFMTIFSAPFAYAFWGNPSTEDFMWVFGIALTSNILQYTLAKSLSMVDITFTLPFDFSRLIYTSIIAYFAFGEVLDIPATIGAIIIILSAILTAYHESRTRKYEAELARKQAVTGV